MEQAICKVVPVAWFSYEDEQFSLWLSTFPYLWILQNINLKNKHRQLTLNNTLTPAVSCPNDTATQVSSKEHISYFAGTTHVHALPSAPLW